MSYKFYLANCLSFFLLFGPAMSATDYISQLDKVWQLGTCNCYIFNMSIWEYSSDQEKMASRKIHEFQIVRGTECMDVKEGSTSEDYYSTMTLKAIKKDYPFTLPQTSGESLDQLKDLEQQREVIHNFFQNYGQVGLNTIVFSSENASDPQVIAVSLVNTSESDEFQENQIADIYFYELDSAASQ